MKLIRILLPITLVSLSLSLAGCPARISDGYRPPVSEDPFAAYTANWEELKLISGTYNITFRYADGKRVPLRADLVVDGSRRSSVTLRSRGSLEAIVTVTPDFINLLNNRDRYFLIEENSAENAGRMVGIYLPSHEVASLLSGRGVNLQRFEHTFTDPDDAGGVFLKLFHREEDLRVEAYIDMFGRLRSARYIKASTEKTVLTVTYTRFMLDRRFGLVWPGEISIDLILQGESITLKARDVDINNDAINLDYVFVRRERGKRLFLKDVPPGDPILYRSVKQYVQ